MAKLPDNAIEIAPKVDKLLSEIDVDYRILGGITTAAVIEASQFDIDNRQIITSDDLFIERVRPENGTRRDIDVLIMSDNSSVIKTAAAKLKYGINGLEVSTFGFTPLSHWYARGRTNHVFDWTSKRLMDGGGNHYYAAYPFKQQVRSQSYEPWRVITQHGEFTSLSPPAHKAAYQIRSIGGVRKRDEAKLNRMQQSIDEKFPDNDTYTAEYLDEWERFNIKLLGKYGLDKALEYDLSHLAQDIHQHSLIDRSIFETKSHLLRYLEQKKWANDIGQGHGFLGKLFVPVRRLLNHEHD